MGNRNFDNFINPESMITPGIAGGIAMVISNVLRVQFSLEPKWTALIISLAFGIIVFKAKETKMLKKIIYYAVNSLIIFSVAMGSNDLGNNLSAGSKNIKESEIKTQATIETMETQGFELNKEAMTKFNETYGRLEELKKEQNDAQKEVSKLNNRIVAQVVEKNKRDERKGAFFDKW